MPPQALEERVAFLEGELNGLRKTVERIETRVDHLELIFNQRLTALEERIDRRFEAVDKRFESIDKRFETITEEIRNLRHWVIGFGILITTLISVYQFLSK